jgi:thymidylate kinase
LSNRHVSFVSFSGIDGAGKSTQIGALQRHLSSAGVRVTVITFWDRIVVLSRFREHLSRVAFKGDQGVGNPDRPVSRRDKNVATWWVTMIRLVLYFLDALHLTFLVETTGPNSKTVVIFDRYLYDELANLPLNNRFIRAYVQLLLKLAPEPNIIYIVDADPALARARKPEYPIQFLRRNRAAYLELSKMLANVSVINPGPTEEVEKQVLEQLWKKLPFHATRELRPSTSTLLP